MKKIAILVCLALLVSALAVTASANETVTGTLDFSQIAIEATEDMTAAAEAAKALGAVEVSNLIIYSNYSKVIAGKGYAGEGYYVQKLEAGAGKVFAEAPVLTLNYRMAAGGDNQAYIKIEGSLDGVTYYEFAKLTESKGDPDNLNAKNSTTVTLNGGEGAAVVWVKISIQHWGGPTCGAVDSSTISGAVKEDPNATPVNAVNSTLDFSQIAIEATEDMTAAAEAAKALGAVDVSNLIIYSNYSKVIAGKGYAGEGYYVQKLEAGAGKVFAEAPVLTLNYRMAAGGDNQAYIKIEGSLDGVTYYEFAKLTESKGDPDNLNAKNSTTVTLNGGEGAAVVWVKISIQHWGGPTCGAVDSSTISATVKDAPGGSEQLPTDAVTATYNFAALTKTAINADGTPDYAAAAAALKEMGVLDVYNLYVDDCYNPFVSAKGYAGEGYLIVKLEAGEGKVFANAPVVNLNYRLTSGKSSDGDDAYVQVWASVDGKEYYEFANLQEITGNSFQQEAKTSTTVTLNGGEGHSAVWVKIALRNYGSPDGAGVDSLTISGSTTEGTEAPVTADGFLLETAVVTMLLAAAAVVTLKKNNK